MEWNAHLPYFFLWKYYYFDKVEILSFGLFALEASQIWSTHEECVGEVIINTYL